MTWPRAAALAAVLWFFVSVFQIFAELTKTAMVLDKASCVETDTPRFAL